MRRLRTEVFRVSCCANCGASRFTGGPRTDRAAVVGWRSSHRAMQLAARADLRPQARQSPSGGPAIAEDWMDAGGGHDSTSA